MTDSFQKVLKRAEKEAAKIKSVAPVTAEELPILINSFEPVGELKEPYFPTLPTLENSDGNIKKGFKTSEFWLTLAFSLANIFGAAAQILPPKSAFAAAGISTGIYTFGRTALKLKSLFSSLFHKNSN